LNAPLANAGQTAIFNVDWSFLDERPYLLTFVFYSTISSGTANQQACHFTNIQVQNGIAVNNITNGLIQNKYTGCIGVSRTSSLSNQWVVSVTIDVNR
jgi:hypothetical protein